MVVSDTDERAAEIDGQLGDAEGSEAVRGPDRRRRHRVRIKPYDGGKLAVSTGASRSTSSAAGRRGSGCVGDIDGRPRIVQVRQRAAAGR